MTHSFATDEERWTAVVQRNASAAGCFFYGVRTTGVFCRPGCGARLPARRNVVFFENAAGARAAGFRPCRRCAPEGRSLPEEWAAAVAKACRMLEESAVGPSNAELAAAAGWSSSHFQRVFKQLTGLTPKQYAGAARAERVRNRLLTAPTVTDAVYEAGFGSSSRFYSGTGGMLGMAPSEYLRRGAGVPIRYGVAPCSLGYVLVAATSKGVCAVALGDDPAQLVDELASRFPEAALEAAGEAFQETVAAVTALVEQPAAGIDLPLDLQGTVFQRRVWEALRRIPGGSTATYAEVARVIGSPSAVRAVAGACAANPVAVVVPCHRVVRSDGTLSGYRWGVERKRELLAREGGRK